MSLPLATRGMQRVACAAQRRAFSSSPAVAAAAEVNKLGVLGAGQMVSLIIGYTEYRY